MVMTDPTVGSLTRIHDANMVKHESLEAPVSKTKRDIAGILKHEGFVRDVEYIEDDKQSMTHALLKSGKNGERVTANLKRISRPGLHACIKANEVSRVLNDLGIVTISTSEGVVTDKEVHGKNIGDEVTAYVW